MSDYKLEQMDGDMKTAQYSACGLSHLIKSLQPFMSLFTLNLTLVTLKIYSLVI